MDSEVGIQWLNKKSTRLLDLPGGAQRILVKKNPWVDGELKAVRRHFNNREEKTNVRSQYARNA
ncbi:MAG: hypothetical protein R3C68_06005 [Myxococcota bacterium]